MIMTEAYRRILARAAHGQLPPWVVEQSEPDFRCIRDLYEEKCLVGLHVALSQSCLCEAKSEHRISDNQWLARLNFPVFGNLRQSRLGYILLLFNVCQSSDSPASLVCVPLLHD